MNKLLRKFAMGAAFAALAGYVAGVLTAPKSGRETREDLRDKAMRSKTEAEKELKKLHTELNALIEQSKQKGNMLGDRAGQEFSRLLDLAKESRDKARTVLSAVHEGDAEDKDLAKAIQEANKAIEHLRNYLQK
jgi:gas vesicle protein